MGVRGGGGRRRDLLQVSVSLLWALCPISTQVCPLHCGLWTWDLWQRFGEEESSCRDFPTAIWPVNVALSRYPGYEPLLRPCCPSCMSLLGGYKQNQGLSLACRLGHRPRCVHWTPRLFTEVLLLSASVSTKDFTYIDGFWKMILDPCGFCGWPLGLQKSRELVRWELLNLAALPCQVLTFDSLWYCISFICVWYLF